MAKIEALYPRIRWGLVDQSANGAAQATMDRRGCDGVVTTYNQYQAWRTDVGFCKLEVAEVMAPARGHWITNRKSWCVAAALNYAIAEMDMLGSLELTIAKHFPKLPCGDTSAGGDQMDDYWEEGAEEEDRRSRRLSQKDATTATKHRRRLSDSGSSGGSGGVPKMEILDFLGMFIIWMIVTVWMLFWTCAPLASMAPLRGLGAMAPPCPQSLRPAPCGHICAPRIGGRCHPRQVQGQYPEDLCQDRDAGQGRWRI